MRKINGDIFRGQWDGFVHGCNLYKTMGAGIAKEVKKKFPKAFKADFEATPLLGHYSHTIVKVGGWKVYVMEDDCYDDNDLKKAIKSGANAIRVKGEHWELGVDNDSGSDIVVGGYIDNPEPSIRIVDIFNLYSQEGIGNLGDPLGRNARYDAIHDGLYRICEHIQTFKEQDTYTLALPEIGCGLAGGDKRIVHAIMESVEEIFLPEINFDLYIY